MNRNIAGQHIVFYAFDSTTSLPKTGDAANITAYVSKDGGTVTVLADTSAAELSSTNAKGSYQFDVAQGETNANMLLFTAKSTTANVVLLPVLLFTEPENFNSSQLATQVDTNTLGSGITFIAAALPPNFVNLVISGGGIVDANVEEIIGGAPAATDLSGMSIDYAAGAFEADLHGAVSSIAPNGILNTSFLPNAIDATALAADAAVKISAAVWDRQTTDLTVAGSIGKALVTLTTGIGGAFNITITVTDGVNPLQNAHFTLWDGATLVANGMTDASGHLTLSGNAGSYTVALVKGNYTFGSVTRTITGEQTGTLKNDLVMTAVTPIIPPVNPDLGTFYGVLFGPSGPATNVEVKFNLVPQDPARPLTANGNVVSLAPTSAFTDGTGTFSIDVLQSILTDDPSFWHIVCEVAQIDLEGVTLGAVPVDIATL